MQLLLVAIAVQANVPVILWGMPGEAKSALLAAMFHELGWPFELILGSTMDPTDIGGWPKDDGEEIGVRRRPPAWAMRLSVKALGQRRAALLFEELNLSPKAVQSAMMRVVHEQVVGELQLAPGVARIAAANPQVVSAGGWHLDPPFANRFFHIDWNLTLQYWVEAMLAGFPRPQVVRLPADWEQLRPGSRSLVAAYLMSDPTKFKDVPRDEEQASRAFPTPRSWSMAADLLAAADAMGAALDVKMKIAEGCVGEGAARGFIAYTRDLDLPKPEDMLAAPKKIKWPKRGDQMYAALTSLTTYVISKGDAKSWEKAWDVFEVAAGHYKDVAAACARVLSLKMPKGAEPPESAETFYDVMLEANLVIEKAK
jgi:hypothetical protein